MRRLIGAVLLIVGAAIFILGIGSASWWKPPAEVTATTHSDSKAGVIATEPGVLELVNDEVEVTASAPGTRVEMVVARTERARLWLGQTPYVSVTGLSDWETLKTEDPADPEAPESLQLEGSDLFIPENFFSGEGQAEVTLAVPQGDFTLIAVGADGTTPSLSLSWNRQVNTPMTMPLIISGIILAAAGAALFMYDSQSRRIAARGQDRSDMWVADAKIPADRAEATGRAYGAAIIPASPRADELRGRELAEEDRIIIAAPEDEAAEGAESADVTESQAVDNDDTDNRGEATGRAYGAAIIPASPRAEELRGRELTDEHRIMISPAGFEDHRATSDFHRTDHLENETEVNAFVSGEFEEAYEGANAPHVPLLPLEPAGRLDDGDQETSSPDDHDAARHGDEADAAAPAIAQTDRVASESDPGEIELAGAVDDADFEQATELGQTVELEPSFDEADDVEAVLPEVDLREDGSVEQPVEKAEIDERGVVSGRAYGAGIIPASPRAEELRGRELTDDSRIIPAPADDLPEADAAGDEGEEQAADGPEYSLDDQAEEAPAEAAYAVVDAGANGLADESVEDAQADAEQAGPAAADEAGVPTEGDAEHGEPELDGWEQPEAIWPEVNPQPVEAASESQANELPPAEEIHLEDTPEQEEATPVRRQYNWRKLWGFGSKEEE